MLTGLGVTLAYMLLNAASVRAVFNLPPHFGLIGGIQPISAGILGVPIGFLTIWVGSLARPHTEMPLDLPLVTEENPFPGL
jgi:cation/acetate symporter